MQINPIIAISSCLLGEKVRYDGETKRNALIIDTLQDRFELLPLCPEVAIGMGVPRAPIQLLKDGSLLRLCEVDQKSCDVTLLMQQHAEEMARRLSHISGYIFKARSPSCGLRDTPVFNHAGEILQFGAGLYAGILGRYHPALPVMDEEMFMDELQRESFIAQVLTYHQRELSS